MLQQEDPLVTALASTLLNPVQILDFSASTNSTTLVQKVSNLSIYSPSSALKFMQLLRASNPPLKRHVIYAGLTRFLQASTFFLVAQDRSAGPVLRLVSFPLSRSAPKRSSPVVDGRATQTLRIRLRTLSRIPLEDSLRFVTRGFHSRERCCR